MRKFFKLLAINIVLFEVFLRVLVFGIFQFHSIKFAQTLSEKNFKIMVIGESTSDRHFSDRAWPTQLQETLNLEKKNAQILNFAVSGINTNLLLNDLESQIRYHKPQILISMMGINDTSGNWYYDNDLLQNENFLLNLRIVKLFKLAKAYFFSKPATSNISDGVSVNLPQPLAIKLFDKKFDLAKTELAKLLLKLSEGEKAALITHVLKQITDQNLDNPHVLFEAYTALDIDAHVKDLVYKDNPLALHVMMALKPSSETEKTCETIAKGYLDQKSLKPSNLVIHFLTKCLPSDNKTLKALINYYAPNIKYGKSDTITKNNYLQVFNLINENQMCWIIEQYPLLNINERKAYFSDEELSSDQIKFVSNLENFNQALKEKKFESLFIDRFAEHFGHTTEYGSKLIADQVYHTLQELMQNPNCSGRP